MREKSFWLAAVFGLGLLFVQPGLASTKFVDGQKDFYFGHISYVEIKHDGKDPVVFREGQARPEIALLNLPLGPGDVIQTSDCRRCEIQFDNGTIVRLDFETELKIETILAPSLSTAKKVSNLLLAKGQAYVMYKKYDSLEVFQVITPLAAVKPDHHAIAVIQVSEEGTDVQIERGKARLLFGPDKFNLFEAKVNAKERIRIAADHQAHAAGYAETSDFLAWNASVNENFRALHEESFLPQPIQRLPRAVFYFAQRYGNQYGEWLWHPLYGYVWRPYYNDFYPWGTWQPLYYGKWAAYQGQLFWIPEEPWGWVPYHLGIWVWDVKKGWLWLPGSMFAPAWAVWDFAFGYYMWRPWSLLDWYFGPSLYWHWTQSAHGMSSGLPYEIPGESYPREVLYSIRKDQLKKKNISMPLPKEMKKTFKTTVKALERADEGVLSSLRGIPRQALAVKKEDLSSARLHEKTLRFEEFVQRLETGPSPRQRPIPRESSSASLDALRTIQRGLIIGELRFRAQSLPGSKEEPGSTPSPETSFFPQTPRVPPEMRGAGRVEGWAVREIRPSSSSGSFQFRDWNPDVKAALRMGVRIAYSSRTNEVACPELGLASRTVSPGMRATGRSFGGSHFSSSPGAQGGQGTSSSSGATSGGAQTSSGASHSSGSRGGGRAEKN